MCESGHILHSSLHPDKGHEYNVNYSLPPPQIRLPLGFVLPILSEQTVKTSLGILCSEHSMNFPKG